MSTLCLLVCPGLFNIRRTRVDKVNAELVTLTYGTIVAQLCTDYEYDYTQVNQQLDKMGYNIGMRLIEDFLAKSNAVRCGNFRETADMISKVGVLRQARKAIDRPTGRLQDVSEYHADSDQLELRQQVILTAV